MATPVLSDQEFYGNKVAGAVLQDARLSETLEGAPTPGKLQLVDGVPHYISPAGLKIPTHHNAITEIVDPSGNVVVSQDGTKVTLVISSDGSKPGLISPELYALLTGASTASDPNTLALRNADGNLVGWRVIADEHIVAAEDARIGNNVIAENAVQGSYLQAFDRNGVLPLTRLSPGRLVGLQVPPPDDSTVPDRGSYAVSVDYLESTLESAIATANATSAQNVNKITSTAPIITTRTGQDVNIDIAAATATTPGAMSAEMYSLLAPVEASPDATVAYIGQDSEGAFTLQGGNTAYIQSGQFFATQYITTPVVSGLTLDPTQLRADYAAPVVYVDNQIRDAIATANAASSQNVASITGTAPIIATRTGQDVTVDIAPATATTPGAMSAEHYALLDGATSEQTPDTVVLRDQYGDIRAAQFQASDEIAAPVVRMLQSPQRPDHVVNLGYLQNALRDAIAGMDRKAQGVRAALDTHIPLGRRFGTFDGVAIAEGDTNTSILLFNQENPAENGPYNVTADGLVRRADSNNTTNLTNGATYQVESGTYANHIFTLVTQNGFTLDTDPLTFLDISGVNVLRSGAAIEINDQRISVRTTPGRTIINADNSVDIDPNWVGQTSITTLGEVLTGTWSANTIAIEHGGTKATTAEGARINLGVAEDLRFVLGDGVATQFTVAHGLGNLEPFVYGYYNGKKMGDVDFDVIDGNVIRVNASLGGTPVAANSLAIHVVGKKAAAAAAPTGEFVVVE